MSDLEAGKNVVKETEDSMQKAIDHLNHELSRLRAGRATQHTLDPVKVDSYGSLVPVNQVGNVAIPEPRLIVITPWDKNLIKNIEAGIIKANIGLNPSSDGNVIRLTIPELTEERRRDIVKQVKTEGENAKISIRNARKDGNNELDKLEKDKAISEDIRDMEKENIQDLVKKFNEQIDEIVKEKEKDIMTV